MFGESYKIYYESNISLVRSLVIKSETSLQGLKNKMKILGHEEGTDPEDWLYYKTLAGEYHPTHKKMYIKSSDDLQEILFDKDILKLHPLTRTEYREGQPLRLELERRFPDQVDLIERILNPVDKQKAIAARDFEILYWDPTLLDINETNVMAKLQSWIDGFQKRWFNRYMHLTDVYFPMAFFHIFYQAMVNRLVEIRLENVFTPYACQWHIWSYLSGFYRLDEFKDYLDIEQSLFLYRNIRHLRRIAGSNDAHHLLVKRIVEKSGLVALKFDLVKLDANFFTNGHTTASFNQANLEDSTTNIDPGAVKSSLDILDKSRYYAPNNEERLLDKSNAMETGLNSDAIAHMPAAMIEYSQKTTDFSKYGSLSQLQADYWAYLSVYGYYRASIVIPIPGKTPLNLTPKDALILLIYSSYKARGINPTLVPPLWVKRLIPETYNTSYIDSLLNPEYVDKDRVVPELTEDLVTLREVTSPAELVAFCNDVVSQNNRQFFARDYATRVVGKSMIEQAAASLYVNIDIKLATDGTTFADWLTAIEFDPSGIEPESWIEVGQSCMLNGASLSQTSGSLPIQQQKIVELVDRLTSYSLVNVPGRSYSGNSELDWNYPDFDNHRTVVGRTMGIDMNPDPEMAIVDGKEVGRVHQFELGGTKMNGGLDVARETELAVGQNIEPTTDSVSTIYINDMAVGINNVSTKVYDLDGNEIN